MITRRAVFGAAGAVLVAPSVRAQGAWPDKPIRFIIGGASGGVSDIFLRMMENRLRETLGQPLIIEPRPGAGGMVGAEVTARSTPDGYTFYVNHVASHGIGPTLYRRLSFDPLKDLPGVARIAAMPNVLIVKGDGPIRSVQDLVAFCKANPSRANFSSAGSGTSSHLSGLLFGMRMGIDVTHVPYRGTAPSMAAVLNGEVLFNIDNAPVSRQQVLAGMLRALGVSTARRASMMPELAPLQDQGVPDFDVASWYGVAMPAAVPVAIRDRLGAEIVSALNDPGIAQRLRDYGAEPWPLGPADYDAFMRAEVEKWAPVVRASGAQVD
ncbi:tripartite tricarboxylate transporter substrate binding protein [Roseomonas sp. HJA6]|uniref:Tripartite tricarboxylate transporter substrate binding protein n=1 Tax=Roseomonas alba TaxID=2846776 RepID=A0ABS7ADP3_9PROT|nr:tripartite tricarboxylate transporter substrate binding protein [Neoroseomonas alba]MBW6400428.1 tripartite tricarboxylate transporter substrate binding protein [Neoroseomonas alba]